MSTLDIAVVRIPNVPAGTVASTGYYRGNYSGNFTTTVEWSLPPGVIQPIGRIFEFDCPIADWTDSDGGAVDVGAGNGSGFMYFVHINPDVLENFYLRCKNVSGRRFKKNNVDHVQFCGVVDYYQPLASQVQSV